MVGHCYKNCPLPILVAGYIKERKIYTKTASYQMEAIHAVLSFGGRRESEATVTEIIRVS